MAGETTNFNEYSTSAFKGLGYQVCVLDRTHEITTGELELADKVRVGVIPAGAVYLDAYIAYDDLDTSTGLSLELGDANDVDGLVDGTSNGQSSGVARGNGAYLINKTTLTSDTTILLNVTAAATSAAAGTVRAVVLYYTP